MGMVGVWDHLVFMLGIIMLYEGYWGSVFRAYKVSIASCSLEMNVGGD